MTQIAMNDFVCRKLNSRNAGEGAAGKSFVRSGKKNDAEDDFDGNSDFEEQRKKGNNAEAGSKKQGKR